MKTALKFVFMFGLMAALAFAQQSSFGRAAQGISVEMVAIARVVAVILAVYCGITLMSSDGHGAGGIAKISGFFIGAVFALFANPIISFIQGIG